MRKILSSPKFYLLLLIIPISWPLFYNGFFSIHDETHILDLYEMIRSLEVQGFPPRFIPDVNFGLGHPYFNFYYHLPFYITSIFHYMGMSLTQSFKGAMFISILGAAFGFYYLAKRYVSAKAALIGAVLYIYAPYFAVDLYVRGALGELAIWTLLPWAVYFFTLLLTKPSLVNFILSSISVGLIAIAHNVLNIFIFPILFIFGVILISVSKKIKKNIILLFGVFILGMLLASYYWLPALLERQFISSYEQIKFEDHFPFIKQLIVPHWGYSISHWGPNDDISFQLGIANIIAVIASLFGFKYLTGLKKRAVLSLLVLYFFCVFLMNSRSLFIWNIHPILRFVQFPWRMLLFTSFFGAILGAIAFDVFVNKLESRRSRLITSITILVAVSLTAAYFKPSQFKQISDERYLELYLPNRTLKGDGNRGSLSKDYLNFTEDFIPLTKYQKERLRDLPKDLVTTEKPAQVKYTRDNLKVDINLNSETDNLVYVYQAFFPGWSALLDGQPKAVFPLTKYGIMGVNLPKGEHNLKISFENTPIRQIANLISLFSFCLIIGLLIRRAFFGLRKLKND